MLESHGLNTFLDEEELRVCRKKGRDEMYDDMEDNKAAVFILTTDFVKKEWLNTVKELQHFQLWRRAEEENWLIPLLIPIFYGSQVK